MNPIAPCKLCGKTKELQESHIIPAFAIRWLKETSATGYLREGENPARRVQDGLKEYMLCSDCEQEFSKHEREFSNRVFNPFNGNPTGTYRYGPWMERFCVSVSWRILEAFWDLMTVEAQEEALSARQRWRDYLMYRRSSPGPYRQHLIPLHPVGNALPFMPNSINRYLLRGIDGEFASDGTNVITYAKVGRFAIFGLVTRSTRQWERTEVGRTGAVLPRRIGPPPWLMQFFSQRAIVHDEARSEIPESQHLKIDATMLRNMDRAIKSGSAEAMRHDAKLFGRSAVTRPTPGSDGS